jgi:hypothetical protein
MRIGLVMRLVLLLALGCGAEEKEREVSEDTYPEEYAEMICSVQEGCDMIDDQESCMESVVSQWEGKLNMGCFNEAAARECLDTLDAITCDGYLNDEWSICSDVDDCSEV